VTQSIMHCTAQHQADVPSAPYRPPRSLLPGPNMAELKGWSSPLAPSWRGWRWRWRKGRVRQRNP
jgi:hypothetical protein